MMLKTIIYVLVPLYVCCSAETTNIVPNNEIAFNESNPKMIWGQATNFLTGETAGRYTSTQLRSGIDVKNGIIVLSGTDLEPVSPARLVLENCSSASDLSFTQRFVQGVLTVEVAPTNCAFFFLPPISQRFTLMMIDENGNQVPKTAVGKELSKPTGLEKFTLSYRFERTNHARMSLLPKEVVEIPFLDLIGTRSPFTRSNVAAMWELNPAKYFALDHPGLYKLLIAQHLFVVGTNSYLKQVALPSVTVDVKVNRKEDTR